MESLLRMVGHLHVGIAGCGNGGMLEWQLPPQQILSALGLILAEWSAKYKSEKSWSPFQLLIYKSYADFCLYYFCCLQLINSLQEQKVTSILS